jgi:hypothetical protein
MFETRVRWANVENVAFADFRACYRCRRPEACETCRFRPETTDQTGREPDTRALFLVPEPELEKSEA